MDPRQKLKAVMLACLLAMPGTQAALAAEKATAAASPPSPGAGWHVATYEAEAGRLAGKAAVIGAPDGSSRAVGNLAGEASQRRAVVFHEEGDAVSWTLRAPEAGANAIVVRFSLADAPAGGGRKGSLDFLARDASGKSIVQARLHLDSRYSWLYGGVMDGTRLYKVPASAARQATAASPTHLYDEIQLKLPVPLRPGTVVSLAQTAESGAAPIAVDFIEFEIVPAPLPQPRDFLSIADPACGAIALDRRASNAVFDGEDDSSYGSLFHSVAGSNPFNPPGFAVAEKVSYATDPVADDVQDEQPNASANGLSMFDLADHNLHSLQTCVELVASSSQRYVGVWVPPGRFYVRGRLLLRDGVAIQGAGMWYAKFAAVDTEAPAAAEHGDRSGIAGRSGNLVIASRSGGASSVLLADFAVFGNVTQRDTVDTELPIGIQGEFRNSSFRRLWFEHVFTGIQTQGATDKVEIVRCRVRNSFADGIALYGSTSHTLVSASQARSTGDDGIALWSQGETPDARSQGNVVSDSVASLQWYGNGISVYGGSGNRIVSSRVADVLNYPCLQISSQFVAPALPASATMSASASKLDLYRCGGDGFRQRFGALLIGAQRTGLDGVTIDHVNIHAPSYRGIDIRPVGRAAERSAAAVIDRLSISTTALFEAPACAGVHPRVQGSARFDGVCACQAAGAGASTCAIDNASPASFRVSVGACDPSACVRP